jgi:hypothetical protein
LQVLLVKGDQGRYDHSYPSFELSWTEYRDAFPASSGKDANDMAIPSADKLEKLSLLWGLECGLDVLVQIPQNLQAIWITDQT